MLDVLWIVLLFKYLVVPLALFSIGVDKKVWMIYLVLTFISMISYPHIFREEVWVNKSYFTPTMVSSFCENTSYNTTCNYTYRRVGVYEETKDTYIYWDVIETLWFAEGIVLILIVGLLTMPYFIDLLKKRVI